MPNSDSDGDDEKGRVNLVLPKPQKEKWATYVEEEASVDSISALVRMSVEKEISGEDGGVETEEIRRILNDELQEMDERVREIQRSNHSIRESQLSDDDIVNMVTTATIANDDFYELVKDATQDGMEEESVVGIEKSLLDALVEEAKDE